MGRARRKLVAAAKLSVLRAEFTEARLTIADWHPSPGHDMSTDPSFMQMVLGPFVPEKAAGRAGNLVRQPLCLACPLAALSDVNEYA
jgi:hypothetical protein